MRRENPIALNITNEDAGSSRTTAGECAYDPLVMRDRITSFLEPFELHELIHAHAVHVLSALPDDVLSDVMGDSGVVFYDYEPGPGVVMQAPVRQTGWRQGVSA